MTTMPRVASPPTVIHELDGPGTCDMCGTPGLKTELVRDPFIYGAGDDGVELVVEIPVRTCSSCGPYTDDQAEDIRHDEVCRHLGVLTPTEIRDLRAKYDISRAELARITGLGESSIARWETREIVQNVGNDRLPETASRSGHLPAREVTRESRAGPRGAGPIGARP